MTQALLNNLNINPQEMSFSVKDNVSKAVTTDFAKIFDKTNAAEAKSKNTTQTTKVQQSDKHTIGDIKSELNSQDTFKTEFNNAIQESAADTVVDMSIIVNEAVEEEAETIAETAAEEIEEEVNQAVEELAEEMKEEAEEEITDIIITDEEPTMNNELTTLENPTVALMLHSQIQTTVKNVVTNKDAETDEGSSVTLKQNNNQSLDNNNNLFKQFDTSTAKDAVANLPKDDVTLKQEFSKSGKVFDPKVIKELNVQVVENEPESDSSSADLMRQQTPQEQVAKIMIQGDVKFDRLAFDTVKITEVKPTEISTNKIIEQITKQMEGMYNNSKLNMVLNPGTLGKVNLQIINSKDGLSAQFTVTTQDARDILMKGLSGLKDNLLAQGINVDSVSVKLEDSNDSEYKQDWTEQEGSRGGNKQQGSQKQQKEQEKPFEQMMFELTNDGKV